MTFIKANKDEISEVLQYFDTSTRVIPQRSVFLVGEPEPTLVLKPLKIGSTQAYFTGVLLSQEDQCSVLPQLIRPNAGGYYLWYHGNRYLLTTKLPGREADYKQVEDLQAAIKTMAKFHRIGGELLKNSSGGWRQLKFRPEIEWPKRLREMEVCRDIAIRSRDPWSKQYLREWHKFYALCFRALQEVKSFDPNAMETVCYHDWAYHNLLIDQEQAYLIDFDYMLVDHSVHDRANLIGRYLRLNQWTFDSLLKILWNFDRFYQWKKGELKLLRVYLTFPYDFWMLGRQYFLEKQPWSQRYFQDQWERKINHQKLEQILELTATME